MIGNNQVLVEKKTEGPYYVDPRLKLKWDNIRNGILTKLDEDRVYTVDGREGSGKSLFTFQQAYYIDPTIIEGDLPRVVFSPEDFLKQVRETKSDDKQTKVIIFDEAFRGLSSRAALSKVNKQIVQALMEMRQNNLVVFIVLPSFFLLDMYPALLRSNALFHIIKRKNSRQRSFKVYNYQQKAKLYKDGVKKGWNYKVQSALMSRFYGIWPGGDEVRDKYLKKKQQALLDTDKIENEDPGMTKTEQKNKALISVLYEVTKSELKWSQAKLVEYIAAKTGGFLDYDRSHISRTLDEARQRGLIVSSA